MFRKLREWVNKPKTYVPNYLPKVSRLEVIDHRAGARGRIYSVRSCRVELSYQDGGRTLKVFVDDPKE